jgi:hypothetical protein
MDAIVGHGHPATIAAKVGEHVAAGADHVTLMLPIDGDFSAGVDQLEQLPRRWSSSPNQRDRDSHGRVTCSVLDLDAGREPRSAMGQPRERTILPQRASVGPVQLMVRHADCPAVLNGGGSAGLVATVIAEDLAGEHDHVVVADGEVGVPATVGEQCVRQRLCERAGQVVVGLEA